MNSASISEIEQRIAAEKDPAAEAEAGVEQRVDGAQGEDGVEDGRPVARHVRR